MRSFLVLLVFTNMFLTFGQDSVYVKQEIRENAKYRNETSTVSSTSIKIYYESDPYKKTLDSLYTLDSNFSVDLTTTGKYNLIGEIPMISTFEELHFSDSEFGYPDDVVLHSHWDGVQSYFDSVQSGKMSTLNKLKLRSAMRLFMKNVYSPEFGVKKGDTAKVPRAFSLPIGAEGQTEIVCTYSYILKEVKGDIAYFDILAEGGTGDIRFEAFEMNYSGDGTLQFDLKNNCFQLIDFDIIGNGQARQGREMGDVKILMHYQYTSTYLGAK